MSNELYGLDNRPAFNTPGLRRLLLIPRADIQGVQVADPDEVEELRLRYGAKYHLFSDLDNLSYVLNPEITRNGTLYTMEVGFTVNIQTRAKNALFEALLSQELAAIVTDKNNRWWVLGLDQPLRLVSQEQKVDNEVNQYTIKLAGKQRENVKQMSPVWVIALTAGMFSAQLDAVDGATLDIKFVSANSNGGIDPPAAVVLPNNFQTTVVSPPSGYTVVDTVGVVMASAGTTIKLPQGARNGQQHTVKDLSGVAGSAVITVNGNGYLIDGFPELKINTDYGSVTVTWINSAWLTTSAVTQ